MRVKMTAALLATASFLALAPLAHGAAGLPDPTFGVGGFTRLDDPAGGSGRLQDLVIQPDGKIVGGGFPGGDGGFLLARVGTDGAADTAFGSGGIRVEPDTGDGSPHSIAAIEQRPDGRIVAAGLARSFVGGVNAFGFARYLTDGALDESFGTAGLTIIPVAPTGFAEDVALAPDQKVVGVGRNGEGKEVAVVRLKEGGGLDNTFSGTGIVYVDVPGTGSEDPHTVEVLADGSILIGGSAGELGAFLVKLHSDGEPVMEFDEDGIATHNLGTSMTPTGSIEDLEVLGDGSILAAGKAGLNPDTELFVARFTPNGDLVPGFGSGGVFRHSPTPMEDAGQTTEMLPDGRILVAGYRDEGKPGTGELMIARLSADGRLDQGFGTGGETAVNAGLGRDRAEGLALQPDGKAVIAGFAEEPGNNVLIFGRFSADEPVSPAPPPQQARCRGRVATITGTPNDDLLGGTAGPDIVVALGGDDKVNTAAGNDLICAGRGQDIVRAGKGKDTVYGEAGRDLLYGGPARDRLFGGPALDLVFGNGGNDRLSGGPGRRDLCNGGAGRRDRRAGGCERRKRFP